MQFSTLVLPAPFGPINPNSSPGSMAKDTSSSTCSPPKRKVRRSTPSSAIPASAAPILLDVAIAAPAAGPLPEIEFLDVLVAAEAGGIAVEDDAAVLQHVAVIGDFERYWGALFDKENGDAEIAADFYEPFG